MDAALARLAEIDGHNCRVAAHHYVVPDESRKKRKLDFGKYSFENGKFVEAGNEIVKHLHHEPLKLGKQLSLHSFMVKRESDVIDLT